MHLNYAEKRFFWDDGSAGYKFSLDSNWKIWQIRDKNLQTAAEPSIEIVHNLLIYFVKSHRGVQMHQLCCFCTMYRPDLSLPWRQFQICVGINKNLRGGAERDIVFFGAFRQICLRCPFKTFDRLLWNIHVLKFIDSEIHWNLKSVLI